MFSAGLLATNTIFYTIFLLTCGILLYFNHSDILKFNLRTGIAIGVITLIILHITRVQISTYILPANHLAAEYDLPARSVLYQTAINIVSKDFIPLGSGLASFGTDASGLYYSEIYSQYGLSSIDGLTPQNWYSVSDSYYPSLAQFGIIGIILYLFFWGGIIYKSFVKFRQNSDIQLFVLTLILISFIFIENLSDSFLTSNKGYYMMMFLGVLFGKKKQTFYTHKYNEKIEIAPGQANLQGERYQMPPIPVRENDSLEKDKDSSEYASHSSHGKKEIEDNNYYDEDEDYYFDDNDDFDEAGNELTETHLVSDPKNINNKKTEGSGIDLLPSLQDDTNTGENDIEHKTDKIITISDQEVPNAAEPDLNDNIIPINDSFIPDQTSNSDSNTELTKENEEIHQKELVAHTPPIEDNNEELQNLPSSIQNMNKVESRLSVEDPNDTEHNTEETVNISDQEVANVAEPNLTNNIPLENSITDNDMSESNNPDTELSDNNEKKSDEQSVNEIFSNDNNEIESDHTDDPEIMTSENVDNNVINPESKSEKNTLVDENIYINKSNTDFSPEINTTESLTDNLSKSEKENPDTINIDIENKTFIPQIKLELTKPESDLVKEYREIVDEHIIQKEENKIQEINKTSDYLKYLEDYLTPTKQEKTHPPLKSKDENDEPEEQIDYMI